MKSAPRSCGPVLVVDDDPAALELLRTVLVDAGYAVEEAASGEAALRLAELTPPRLAVLDVCMPALSGHEVCRQLRERYGDAVPVLFVSGERVEPVDRAAGLLIGGDDYMLKPFSPDELIARVRALLRRSADSARQVRDVRLTRRELEVLGMLGAGLHRREIAGELVISEKTVGAHLGRIYEKLGAHDRVQALIIAYRLGLLDPLETGRNSGLPAA